jgi:ATP synthase protein I
MADANGPGETGKPDPGHKARPDIRDDELERRRRQLEASLAARPAQRSGGGNGAKGGSAGYGHALRLSSEFIAGILVGVGLGWVIDRVAGTSPWGLIVFLLLGFGAGVLNVLRSVGAVAEGGLKVPEKRTEEPDKD